MQRWEYKTIKVNVGGFFGGVLKVKTFDRALNELGRDGWELVAAIHTTGMYGTSREAVAIFKRPLE